MMIKGYQSEILKIYDNIRDKESKALKNRKAEIADKYPEIMELDNQIQKLSLKWLYLLLKLMMKEKP